MPKLLFDTQDLALQIDVIRGHLRHLYSMNGPPPPDLAADHDMFWPERESERLDKLAELHAAQAATAREAEQRLKETDGDKSPRYRAALSAAVTAETQAKSSQDNADKAKSNLSDGLPATGGKVPPPNPRLIA